MQLRNCLRCGKLFVAGDNPVCPDCLDKDEEDFIRVRKYIFENPNAHVEEVSEATGVSENKIMGYLRDGRLVGDRIQAMITCVNCGAPIKTGNLCEECAGKLAKEIQNKVTDYDETHNAKKTAYRSRAYQDGEDK